uniref:Uncharacterized protein n=1 Tax=Gouania willdenowi TaxID=441366 RepID=A0A8C5EKP8_GOUWI
VIAHWFIPDCLISSQSHFTAMVWKSTKELELARPLHPMLGISQTKGHFENNVLPAKTSS